MLSQEDVDLESFARMPATLKPSPRFPVLADLERAKTPEYDRTSAYLIDAQGIVRQIFPMIIHARPSWGIILREVEKLSDPGARRDPERAD